MSPTEGDGRGGAYRGGPGLLPGPGRRAVTMQDLRPVLVPRRRRPVGVQDHRPAPLVDDDLMVEETEQRAVCDAGRAAVGLMGQMMHFARGGGLVAAAGEPAVLVPQGDGAAD